MRRAIQRAFDQARYHEVIIGCALFVLLAVQGNHLVHRMFPAWSNDQTLTASSFGALIVIAVGAVVLAWFETRRADRPHTGS